MSKRRFWFWLSLPIAFVTVILLLYFGSYLICLHTASAGGGGSGQRYACYVNPLTGRMLPRHLQVCYFFKPAQKIDALIRPGYWWWIEPSVVNNNRTNQPPKHSRFVKVTVPREWRPKITAEEALQLAKTYIQEKSIDISSYYLSVIKMDASWKMVGSYKKVDQQFWTLFWVKPTADIEESLAIAVPMDGTKVRQADVTKDLAMKGHLSKAPEITLERALQLANEYIHTENLDMSAFFLLQVTFVASRGGWWLWWTNVKGGCGNYIEIDVSMDGKVKQRCTM